MTRHRNEPAGPIHHLSDNQNEDASPPSAARGLLRQNIRPCLSVAAFTLIIELGVYFLGIVIGAGELNSTLAALATAAVWIPLASGPLSVGAKSVTGGLLRGGIVADASAVTLIILWLTTPYVTFAAAVKIYCIYAAMAVATIAPARFFLYKTSPAGGYAAAVTAAVMIFASLSSPFWAAGPARAAGPPLRDAIVDWSVYANPFYCVLAAIVKKTGYIWHEQGLMYDEISRLRDLAPQAAKWHPSAIMHLAVAGIFAALALILPRILRAGPANYGDP